MKLWVIVTATLGVLMGSAALAWIRTPNVLTPSAVNPPENLNALLEPILKKYDLPALAGAIVTSMEGLPSEIN